MLPLASARCVTLALLALAVTVSAEGVTAPTGQSDPELLWEQRYLNARLFSAVMATHWGGGQGIALAASGMDHDCWVKLWLIGADGHVIAERQVDIPPAMDPAGRPRRVLATLQALTTSRSGDVVLLIKGRGPGLWMAKVRRAGRELLLENVRIPLTGDIAVSKMFETSDGRFLLLGRSGTNAFVAKLTFDGQVIWHRKLGQGKTSFLIDGIQTSGGGAILVGNSGDFKSFRLDGPSAVWLWAIDAAGRTTQETNFPGRFGSITGSAQHWFVAYDRDGSLSREDLRLRALDMDLKPRWDVSVASGERGFSRVKVAPIGSDELLVVGSRLGRPCLWKVQHSGSVTWERVVPFTPESMDFIPVVVGDDIVLASWIFTDAAEAGGQTLRLNSLRVSGAGS